MGMIQELTPRQAREAQRFDYLREEAYLTIKDGIDRRKKSKLGTTTAQDKRLYEQEAEEAFELAKAIAIVASLYKP